MVLKGNPYHSGRAAYHPRTGERCPANHYGGWVCSRAYDVKSSLELERSMPGHGAGQKTLSGEVARAVERNWPK